jgi:anti-sigma-K factor RskA
LTGVPASKDSHAVVFWNQNKKQVILAGIDLPKSPENKQYQLWALVDGVPVDAGVFDTKSSHDLISMKSIEKSQAFAITLEPKGGSPTPHLEALCVIGNV